MCAVARMVGRFAPCKIVTEGIPGVRFQRQLTLAFLRVARLPLHQLHYQDFPHFTTV